MFTLNIPVINLAPSRAEQWLSCPLSAVLSRKLRGSYSECYAGQVITSSSPKEEEFIKQGVLAHKLAEETINYKFLGGERPSLKTSKIIEEAVNYYIGILNNYIQTNQNNIVTFRAEQQVSIKLDESSKKAVLHVGEQ